MCIIDTSACLDYTEYSYLYPPRPETKVTQDQLAFYQRRGWVAQVKKNGTCTVVFVKGDTVIFKQRHQDESGLGLDHRQWAPLKMHTDFFKSIKSAKDSWNVYVGELLHSKTPSIKNHLYIFDQIVHSGKHLNGTTLLERHAILHDELMTPSAVEEDDLYRLGVGFSIARNLTKDFGKVFERLKPEDEGVVLKNPKAKLDPCFHPLSNNGWQVKSRKLHKNYGF
jgi:hypothetical protein